MRPYLLLCGSLSGCTTWSVVEETSWSLFTGDTGLPETCTYTLAPVAEGTTVLLDWSELPDRDAVDRIVIGRLPFGRRGLDEGRCGPFTWTELLVPTPEAYTLSLTAADVGGQGESTVITLRSLDLEVDSVVLVPDPNQSRTTVSFSD